MRQCQDISWAYRLCAMDIGIAALSAARACPLMRSTQGNCAGNVGAPAQQSSMTNPREAIS